MLSFTFSMYQLKMKKASLYHNFSSLTVPEKLFKVIHSLLRNKVVHAIIIDH